ncbi:alpha/beta hydrolase family protein [Pararoseomonas baculiformis]|nr:hypothetical protein [Pararoseomonas baculiformis]
MALLAGCATGVPPSDLAMNPPVSRTKGIVFLFTGLTFSSEDSFGTGTHTLADNIRRLGVRAEINQPSTWESVADWVIADPGLRQVPLAVYGYSYGAQAALRFTERLAQASIPVQTVVVLEAFRPVPVPCNVIKAIHLYLSDGSFSQATPIAPAQPECGRVVLNRRYYPLGVFPLVVNHWSVSTFDALHREVLHLLLDADRVRTRVLDPIISPMLTGSGVPSPTTAAAD